MTRSLPRLMIAMEFPSLLGGEQSLLAVARALRSRFEFLFAVPPGGALEEQLIRDRFRLVPFSWRDDQGKRKSDEELLAAWHSLLATEKPDLLHANSLTLARFFARHRDQFPIPITGHLRDQMRISKKAVEDLQHLDGLISVSDATRDYYVQQGIAPQQIQRIYNGIELDSHVVRTDLRSELGLNQQVKLAAQIGQVCLRKGQDLLISSWLKLLPDFPEWHLVVIGERYSGKQESRDYFTGLVKELENGSEDPRVHFLGYRTDVRELLPQIDLLIHPARQEPFGRVLLEAAAAGQAIVATSVGGTEEMLEGERSVKLVPPDHKELLIEACRDLMADATLRNKLGQAAQGRIADLFLLGRSAEEHHAFWSSLLCPRSDP
ncbi:MAG: glycosyltransferase family 4 protein [Planctomycetaceae bacterium]|nr:glycosyltransferase family 4 protein [Planctomycetaceae bacterium]